MRGSVKRSSLAEWGSSKIQMILGCWTAAARRAALHLLPIRIGHHARSIHPARVYPEASLATFRQAPDVIDLPRSGR